MLVKMLDKIITNLDNNQSSPAVIATMIDWSAVFDCNSKIFHYWRSGLFNQLLDNYLQGRCMIAKFNGTTSSTYNMHGGCRQGNLLGVLEYLYHVTTLLHCHW